MTLVVAGRKKQKTLNSIIFYVILAIVFTPFVFVFFYMVTTSLKSPLDVSNIDALWVFTPTLDNYTQVLERTDFVRYTINSLVVGLGSVGLAVLIGVPAAYAIARYTAPRTAMFVLLARVTPGITFLIPWFIILAGLRWVDSFQGLILAHLLVTLPMVTWLMIGFFEEIPGEIVDSAKVDGASTMRTLLSVVLPMTRGGLAAASILAFIFSWNHFMFSVVLAGRNTRTLPVAVFEFMSYGQVDWGAICAAATLMTLPVIAIAALVQRQIVQGLAGGAVKG
jgi:multiple sugar transport system permease protein